MHEVLVNRSGGLSLPRKSVVRLTDHPDMTLDVYHGRKTTMQHIDIEGINVKNHVNYVIWICQPILDNVSYLGAAIYEPLDKSQHYLR